MSIQCYFLDVGQGTAQIIRLGNQKAIVIDAGPTYKDNQKNIVLQLLKKWKIKSIEALILSHDHDNHTGGAAEILQEFQGAVKRIYFSQDSNSTTLKEFKASAYPLVTSQEYTFHPLFKRCSMPESLYNDPNISISIELLYPAYAEQEFSLEHNDPNYSSAVILLTFTQNQILFSADAPYSAFEAIFNQRQEPLTLNIMTVPHHGGDIQSNQSQLQSLYSQYINTQWAIISVGTRNSYRHPIQPIIKTIANNNIEIFCTQITSCCCPEEKLELWKHARGDTNLEYSLSTDKFYREGSNNQVKSRDVACAGTIIATLDGTNVQIKNLDFLHDKKKQLEQDFSCTLPCIREYLSDEKNSNKP